MKNFNCRTIVVESYIDEYLHMFEPPKRKIELTDFLKEYCDEMNDFRSLYIIKKPNDNIILCHHSEPIPTDYRISLAAHASYYPFKLY